jgi:hypothetical protein
VGGWGFEVANQAHGLQIITTAAGFDDAQWVDALANVNGDSGLWR